MKSSGKGMHSKSSSLSSISRFYVDLQSNCAHGPLDYSLPVSFDGVLS